MCLRWLMARKEQFIMATDPKAGRGYLQLQTVSPCQDEVGGDGATLRNGLHPRPQPFSEPPVRSEEETIA